MNGSSAGALGSAFRAALSSSILRGVAVEKVTRGICDCGRTLGRADRAAVVSALRGSMMAAAAGNKRIEAVLLHYAHALTATVKVEGHCGGLM
jgi:hypothetical protein